MPYFRKNRRNLFNRERRITQVNDYTVKNSRWFDTLAARWKDNLSRSTLKYVSLATEKESRDNGLKPVV